MLSSMSKSCILHDVLYVPELSYNLVSVAKMSQNGKIVKFTSNTCYILDKRHKMIAKAAKMENSTSSSVRPFMSMQVLPRFLKMSGTNDSGSLE